MSKRLQTVQQSLSGLPEPLVNKNFDPVLAKRDPTSNDTGYPLTQTWLNKLTDAYWILVDVGGGVATWQLMGAGGGSLNTLTGDDLVPVLPNAGNINIQGGLTGAIAFSNGGVGQMDAQVLVDNTTIQITANKLEVIPAGVLAGLQFDPDVGVNVSPVAGVVGVPGIGGNQTLNGGAGILQFNNRRWLSPYVVDPSVVPGQDGEYTTIQSAMDALNAAGNRGIIYIRPGTYTENLTFYPNQEICGLSNDGRIAFATTVFINGNHTFIGDGSGGLFGGTIVQGIFFDSAAGDLFTVANNGPNGLLLVAKFCEFVTNAGHCFVVDTVGAGVFTIAVTFECNVQVTGGNAWQIQGSNCQGQAILSEIQADNFAVNLGAPNTGFRDESSIFNGDTACINVGTASSNASFSFSTLGSNGATINFVGAGSVKTAHCEHSSNNGTGFYVDGAAGSYQYGSDLLTGSAVNIAPGISQNPEVWRPRATAGTSVTAFAGTASFDDTQFTVTDGFVQVTALPILITLSLTTVGAVTVNSADIPITTNSTTLINANFAVDNATSTLGAGNLASGAVRDMGGVVTVINGDFVDVALNEDGALAATDYNLIAGAGPSSFRIQVVGVPVEVLTWKVQISLITSP